METALDTIIKNYVIHELKYESPQRDNVHGETAGEWLSESDEDYIQALHECLEKKGIMRELQAFLRRKLVLVLQEKWPKLAVPPSSPVIRPEVIKLLQDFLCCRKLLYTFSVISGELGLKSTAKVKFGKMTCLAAEELLEQLEIKKDSEMSRIILKYYCEKERMSLLECIIQLSVWSSTSLNNNNSDYWVEDGLKQDMRKPKEKRQNKLTDRFKQIDAYYDSQHKKEVKINQVGADERFHTIEREMEKDKNLGIQQAIRKFKEEEVSKIREEIQHKLEFEMLAKEKELLLNYKEKSQCLKESLDVEKAAWLADKVRQEKEYAEKRQELELMMDAIVKEKNKLQVYSKNISPDSSNSEVKLDKEKVDKEHKQISISPKSFKKNLKEDDSVIREAQLRVTIKRLQVENERLLTEKNNKCQMKRDSNQFTNSGICSCNNLSHNRPQQSQRMIYKSKEQPIKERENASTTHSSYQIDTDKVAFLQYNLERQAEEITLLKQELYLGPSSQKKQTSRTDMEKESAGLVQFLTESKQRCEQIESEARDIDKKLNEIRNRKSSRSCSPVLVQQKKSKSTVTETNYPPLTTNLSTSLMDQFHFSLPQSPIFKQTFQIQQPLSVERIPIKTISRRPSELIATSFNENVRGYSSNKTFPNRLPMLEKTPPIIPESIQTKLPTNMENVQVVSELEAHSSNFQPISNSLTTNQETKLYDPNGIVTTDSKNNTQPHYSEDSNNTIAARRKSDELEKVEKAVKKGALSFEKVVTSDEDNSRPSSYHQDISLGSTHGKNVNEPAERLMVKTTPKKFRASTEEEISVSISAPANDESQASLDQESEFWKL